MTLRFTIAFIILTIIGCALLASHQRKPFPLLIEASYGGEWCDVRPEPPKKPRGKYEYVPGARRQGDIA